ncbi:MAG: DUF4190 domain-containing protein [bacterium]|nr:DUF4190 domain-containing protein [bacterium]
MDRYDREERRYDRGEPDRPGSEPSGSPEDFPWEDSGRGDQPPQVWEAPPTDQLAGAGGAAVPGRRGGDQRNPMAIAGFVCSIVMWIPIPYLNVVFWAAAVTLSSIGLSRARRLGLPYKGLAIAGLCISLIGIVFIVIVILFFIGAIAFAD